MEIATSLQIIITVRILLKEKNLLGNDSICEKASDEEALLSKRQFLNPRV